MKIASHLLQLLPHNRHILHTVEILLYAVNNGRIRELRRPFHETSAAQEECNKKLSGQTDRAKHRAFPMRRSFTCETSFVIYLSHLLPVVAFGFIAARCILRCRQVKNRCSIINRFCRAIARVYEMLRETDLYFLSLFLFFLYLAQIR